MESPAYETMFRIEETHWWYRALHRLIFQTLDREVPDWKTKTILDAGCGTGAILKRLGNPERNVGVDLATEAISFCRKRGLGNVRRADISQLPFSDSSFDVVICSSVIYHEWVTDPVAAVAELHRVLRPGGVLLLNLPAFQFLHSAHDKAVMTARRFRKKQTWSLLNSCGFSVKRLTYWTTLLFPLALLARTLRVSKTGEDFPIEGESSSRLDPLFWLMMWIELQLLRKATLPFGVALFAVGNKSR